jgi:hypothetical protein
MTADFIDSPAAIQILPSNTAGLRLPALAAGVICIERKALWLPRRHFCPAIPDYVQKSSVLQRFLLNRSFDNGLSS